MKFGFGVELVVGLPVVGNVSVLYMISIELGIDSASVTVGAFMLFRGHAEICGGLVGVTIQIEAAVRSKKRGRFECIAQVTFSIDIQILWVIDISFEETWEEAGRSHSHKIQSHACTRKIQNSFLSPANRRRST